MSVLVLFASGWGYNARNTRTQYSNLAQITLRAFYILTHFKPHI